MSLYLGKQKVCPTKTVEKPSMKAFFEAGGKCANSTATSFEGIIQYNDTENVTDMSYMFFRCRNLIEFPKIQIRNATNMEHMFNNCQKITSIPKFDMHSVTNASSMFNECFELTAISELDCSNLLNSNSMFTSCQKLTSISLLNCNKIREIGFMFAYCTNLTAIPEIDCSNVTYWNNVLSGCRSLREIHMKNMTVDFDISASTLFTREALLEIINNCYDLTTLNKTATLTMGATNLAKLTEADKQIATNKGWTLK